MKFFALMVLIAGSIYASPVFGGDCNSGTLDEYIALGSTGCDFEGYTWRDFTFNGTIDSNPIDPADIDITFMVGIVSLHWVGLTSIPLPEGADLSVDFSFAVIGGPIYRISTSSTALMTPDTTFAQQACLNGFFAPTCTGTLLDPPGPGLYDPAANPVAGRGMLTAVGTSTSSFASLEGQIVNVDPALAAPEPGSLVLLGFGLGLVAFRLVKERDHRGLPRRRTHG